MICRKDPNMSSSLEGRRKFLTSLLHEQDKTVLMRSCIYNIKDMDTPSAFPPPNLSRKVKLQNQMMYLRQVDGTIITDSRNEERRHRILHGLYSVETCNPYIHHIQGAAQTDSGTEHWRELVVKNLYACTLSHHLTVL